MLQNHLRIIRSHLFHDLSPQPGGIQHIGLIHAGHLFTPLHCDVKSALRNPADLLFIVCKGIPCGQDTILFLCGAGPEIQPSGQLPHDHHIKSALGDLFLQRACPF